MQKMLLKSFGLAALVVVSPVMLMAQEAPPTPPQEPMPPETPPAPGDPMPAPQPGDPMPAPPAPVPEPMPEPTAAPIMTPATPPQQTTPTEPYPLCTKTLQDSCRNPGEGPKATRKKRS